MCEMGILTHGWVSQIPGNKECRTGVELILVIPVSGLLCRIQTDDLDIGSFLVLLAGDFREVF